MVIQSNNREVTTADLVACEKRIERPIPARYRALLLEHNGGRVEPSGFDFHDAMGARSSCVHRILGIHGGDSDLEEYLRAYRDRVPNDLFVIAHDPGGNLVLIGTGAENDGRIFFWDHDFEADDGETPDYRNVYPVAESLDAFLAALSDDER